MDISLLESEIVEHLRILDPEKIILFGSYATGAYNEESDIDIFLCKDLDRDTARKYNLQARRCLRDLIFKYNIGFDVITAPEAFVKSRSDSFFKHEVLQKGKLLYAK